MKLFLTTLAVLIFLTTFGQLDIKEIDKSLSKINDTLYASKFEVTNRQYCTFTHSLIISEKYDLLAIAHVDSTQWLSDNSYNQPYVDYYLRHPAYFNYPVVNISHEAALLFCKWLTDEYNSNPKRKYNKIQFRLPTEQEWVLAAQGGDNSAIYPWQGSELRNKKGQYLCNFVRAHNDSTGIAGKLNDAADITAPVTSYYPNKFGLYNMSGNVAEMILDKTIVKGGSWMDGAEFMTISSKQINDGIAKPNVGFRYFVDIIEK